MDRPGRRVGGGLDLIDAVIRPGVRVADLPHVVRVDAKQHPPLPPAAVAVGVAAGPWPACQTPPRRPFGAAHQGFPWTCSVFASHRKSQPQ